MSDDDRAFSFLKRAAVVAFCGWAAFRLVKGALHFLETGKSFEAVACFGLCGLIAFGLLKFAWSLASESD